MLNDMEISTYLQVDDKEDNIKPIYFTFGTGEEEVQVSKAFEGLVYPTVVFVYVRVSLAMLSVLALSWN